MALKANRAFGNLESAVLHAVDHAVIATDLEGAILFWNRFAERLYGWRAEEVIGQNILDVTPNTESRALGEEIFERLKRGESWSGEFTVRDKAGRWFRVDVTDTPVYGEDGTLAGIVGTSRRSESRSGLARADKAFRDFLTSAWRAVPVTARFGRQALDATAVSARSAVFEDTARGFLIGAVVIGLATLARLGLDAIVPGRLPFIAFFPAVMAASYFCGLLTTGGVVLTLASIGAFWVDLPPDEIVSFRVWSFTLFTVFGSAAAALVFYLKYLVFRLRERDTQLALVNHELNHRIKNLFAIVSSICLRTARKGTSSTDVATVILGRISAIASAQQLLSIDATEGSDLDSLVAAVVAPIAATPSRLVVNGPHVMLPQKDSTSFALILHELATNAVKHGAWSDDKGTVEIRWFVEDGAMLDLHWVERDGPAVRAPEREGFGSELIKRALSQGRVEHTLKPHGLDCRIRLNLS